MSRGTRDIPYRSRQFTVFFAKCAFSQHTRCTLLIDGLQFQSALHYMLYQKSSEYIVQCSALLHKTNLCEDYRL